MRSHKELIYSHGKLYVFLKSINKMDDTTRMLASLLQKKFIIKKTNIVNSSNDDKLTLQKGLQISKD